MKRFALIIICIIGIAWFAFKTTTTQSPEWITTPDVPTPIPSETKEERSLAYAVDGQPFRVAWFAVEDAAAIKLIPNFTQKASSISIVKEHKCTALTNAGFYSKENTPIGMFVVEGKQLNAYQPNALFNGFFSVDTTGSASIIIELPQGTPRIIVQSGPLFITNGSARKLVIRNDEPARRIIMAQTNDNTVVFLALYSEENMFAGPKLAEVPKHLKEVEKLLGVRFANALNLDGGSASAFIANGISITEFTPVGSFFCVRRDY